MLPLYAGKVHVGQLSLAVRPGLEPLGRADERLLDALGHVLASSAYNLGLQQALRKALAQAVTAREEERRHIRREIYDGIGPLLAAALLHAMGSGSLADFQALYTADVVNREAKNEPPDIRGTGPAATHATARWLRTAFSDLTWTVHDGRARQRLVVVHATMSGRQAGPFVAYRPDGEIAAVFPPRGRTFGHADPLVPHARRQSR